MASVRARPRFTQLLELTGPADIARQPAAGRHLQTGAQRAETEDFEDCERLRQSFDRCRAEWFEREIAFSQLVCVCVLVTIEPGTATLSMRAAMWIELPTGS